MMRVVTVVGLMVFMVFCITPAAEAGDAAKGQEIFTKTCASCHGKTGKGDGPAAAALNPKPKNLSDKAYMEKLGDEYLANIIKKGGAAVGKSPLMPLWITERRRHPERDRLHPEPGQVGKSVELVQA
jgi:mono/diheme cytochrome c family protein